MRSLSRVRIEAYVHLDGNWSGQEEDYLPRGGNLPIVFTYFSRRRVDYRLCRVEALRKFLRHRGDRRRYGV